MYIFFILLIVSFFGTMYALPHSIKKLKENNYLAKDMYKFDQPKIPTNAGMILIFTSFISISLVPLIVRFLSLFSNINFGLSDLSEENLAFLLVISIYALYGLVDDLVDIGRMMKLILPITFAYPLISVVIPIDFWFPGLGNISLEENIIGGVTKSDIFRIIIIPIYVMVVANLVNMHSGYNGLQSGLSIILITTLCIKSFFDDKLVNILPIGSILGAMLSFYIFNKYPSKVFEGNIGSLLFGSAIGAAIVIQEYWWFGFFILVPHIFNFLLWLLWLYLMKKDPDNYLTGQGVHQKFGIIRKDGTLRVPNRLTLKWIPNFYFRLSEKDTIIIIYSITFVFCIMALIIF